MHSADYAVARCPSVRLSIRYTPVLCLNGYTYPQSFFSPSGSPTILVFHTKQDGNTPTGTALTGASNARGYETSSAVSSRRETARRFVSLNILLSHSRSFEMTLLSRACVNPYSYVIETMSVYVVPFMRYSASKYSVTLKTGLGVVQGHCKWRRSIDYIRLSNGPSL